MSAKDLIERARKVARVIPELMLAEGDTSDHFRLQSADEDIDLIDWQSLAGPEDIDRVSEEAAAFVEMRDLILPLAKVADDAQIDLATSHAATNATRLEADGYQQKLSAAERWIEKARAVVDAVREAQEARQKLNGMTEGLTSQAFIDRALKTERLRGRLMAIALPGEGP